MHDGGSDVPGLGFPDRRPGGRPGDPLKPRGRDGYRHGPRVPGDRPMEMGRKGPAR